ncbi:MAG: NUDIX domain-containing protein [Candidatus Thorarchaeota archaeon]
MTKILPIAITILQIDESFLFLKRRNPPYENLWSLVGGKIAIGEHIPAAAKREVMEETGTKSVTDYDLKGVVSERLVSTNGDLLGHFLMFVGQATIDSFNEIHREGNLRCFTLDEIIHGKDDFLPSDFEMFSKFTRTECKSIEYHEVELIQDNGAYHLNYYREAGT